MKWRDRDALGFQSRDRKQRQCSRRGAIRLWLDRLPEVPSLLPSSAPLSERLKQLNERNHDFWSKHDNS